MSLALDSMSPNFRFVSRGGNGAPGQVGGNGGDGAAGPNVAGTTAYAKGFLSKTCEANNFNGRNEEEISSYRSSTATVHYFKGLPANPGSNGGNAGALFCYAETVGTRAPPRRLVQALTVNRLPGREIWEERGWRRCWNGQHLHARFSRPLCQIIWRRF